MSRYRLPHADPAIEVWVGYDPPITTFFGQVFDATLPADVDDCLLWVGQTYNALRTVEALQAALGDQVTIPEAVCDALRDDQRQPHTLSPLQRLVRERYYATRPPED